MADELGEYYPLPVILTFEGIDREMNKTLGDKIGKAGKRAGTDFGKNAAAGIKASEADVKRALDNHAKLADKAADANGKLKVALAGVDDLQKKGITSGQRWERAQAAKEKATRDHTRALRDAENALKDYESAQKDLSAPDFSGFGGDAGDSFMDSFGGVVAGLGTKAGPIGMALAAAGGLAFAAGGAIATQVMAGLEQEAQADHFAAQLGLSENSAAVFGQLAGQVYADNFGESMGDVGQALADVQSTLGQGAGAGVIEDMTAKALTFRDVFGIEVAESIAHAQNLITNGLAPDAATAFDLMTAAFQRVPAAMRGELPEILNEYSTNFQSLGFSGEEAFGLLVKTAPQGKIALDKLGDSLKEFMLLATDIGSKPVQDAFAGMGLDGGVVANNLLAGGQAAQQQFDQVVDGLLAIPDPAQQAAAAIALFGTPLEDLDKAKIPQFLAGLDDADRQMQGFAGSAERMVDTVGSNTAASVETAKRQLEMGMAAMQGSLADAFGPGLEKVATWLTENEDDVTQFFITGANAGAEFGGVMLGMGAAVTSALGLVLKATGDTTSFMLDSFASMAGGASTFADAIGMDGLAADLKNAEGNLRGTAARFDEMGNDVLGLASTLSDGAQSLHNFDANMAATSTSAQNAQAQINNVTTAVGNLPTGHQINIEAIVIFKDQQGRAIDPAQLGTSQRQMIEAGVTPSSRGWFPFVTPQLPAPTPAETSFVPPPQPTPGLVTPSASRGTSSGSASASDEPAPYFDPQLWQVTPSSGGGYPGDAALLANVPAGRYTQEERGDLTQGLADCSSAIEDLVNLMDGRPTGGASMSTHNADEWLRARGFMPGTGGPGDFRVGFNSGHMQATLPGGTPFNWGSAAAAARGGVGGTGAFDPAFTSHYYRPAGGSSIAAGPDMLTPSTVSAGGSNYEVDPQAVFDAESAVLKDQNELEQKRLKLLELKAKGNATQSELLAAENDITEQERDLQSSQAKAAEARRGKLQTSKSTQGGRGGGQGPASGLGPLGEIFGSFLKETTGLDGSFLPDISGGSTMASLNALLNAFVPAGAQADESSAVADAFGMPRSTVDAPPPPQQGPGGSPAEPGPGISRPISIDQSIHGNVGWDPVEMQRQRQLGLNRAIARIPP